MKKLSSLVAFTMAICALVFFVRPTAAPAADVTGTWALTVHYPPTAPLVREHVSVYGHARRIP
jgi:hypothetical protein